ncbi:VRR-NUC domain-containing protein [Propionivibrio sp.]|uniref:VRR-NUC domain-containing protein n=1 Tax=Propionivibrio sp. TaxID=2212460 RepID=UPI003BF309DC
MAKKLKQQGQINLLTGDVEPPVRVHGKPEAAALIEVLRALRAHPAVSWAERMNSGAARIGNRFVKFGFTGCPDVLGQLRDGRLLGVEVKAPKGQLRPEQRIMLERINGAGGLGFIARNCKDVFTALQTKGSA